MPKYLKPLTITWLIYSILTLVGGGIAAIVMYSMNDNNASQRLLAAIFGAIGILCVIGLAKRKTWGWAGILALGVVNLPNLFPFGMVLGLTTVWVLLKKDVRGFFWAKR